MTKKQLSKANRAIISRYNATSWYPSTVNFMHKLRLDKMVATSTTRDDKRDARNCRNVRMHDILRTLQREP